MFIQAIWQFSSVKKFCSQNSVLSSYELFKQETEQECDDDDCADIEVWESEDEVHIGAHNAIPNSVTEESDSDGVVESQDELQIQTTSPVTPKPSISKLISFICTFLLSLEGNFPAPRWHSRCSI